MSAVPKLAWRGVHKTFEGAQVLDDLDLEVDAGRSLVIIGRSGQGKSVTLKLAGDYSRFKRICARHGIEISASRVRKVIKHFEAERERTHAWRKILEQTTSTLLRQSSEE